jgi:hypothetical protein
MKLIKSNLLLILKNSGPEKVCLCVIEVVFSRDLHLLECRQFLIFNLFAKSFVQAINFVRNFTLFNKFNQVIFDGFK